MKRIISVFLVLIFIFGLTACGEKQGDGSESSTGGASQTESGDTESKAESAGNGSKEESADGSSQTSTSSKIEDTGVFASGLTLATSGGASARSLANTYKCLTEKKKLNVLYIGGSLTVGTGSSSSECWRAYTTKWLKESYPDATITEKNSAIGGTGSLWGLGRTKQDVIAHNPDLVFIEFAMNDQYLKLTEAQAGTNIEGMIRQINEALPSTDIVVVITTDKSRLGTRYVAMRGHKKAAEFYGVPCINVGDALIEPVKANGWEYYAADTVHLKAEGYRIYADELIKNLKALLEEAKGKAGGAHVLPAGYVSSNPVSNVTLMDAATIAEKNGEWSYLNGKPLWAENKGSTIAKSDTAVINIEFDGSMIGFYGQKDTKGDVTFKIDGVEAKTMPKSYEKGREIVGIDNLKPGHHKVEIIVSNKSLRLDAIILG